jgi:hypothetical protein
MSVAQVLTEARKLIAQGWTQGKNKRVVNGVECYCLSAAIRQASPDYKPRELAFSALFYALGDDDLYLSSSSNLTEWNDAPDRTQEDVLALIDRAIAKEAKA